MMIWVRWLTVFLWVFFLVGGFAFADSPWLYGIHWYGDTGASDVEAMSGGKGVYVLDQVFTDTSDQGNFWEEPPHKVYPWSQITSKGHTLVARLHPNWGRAVPKPGDSYSIAEFVLDCVTAAETLKNQCHIWQLSNEMNILAEYGGAALSPGDYVSAYKQVHTAIHSVSSLLGPQIVLLGPVSPGAVIPGIRYMNGDQYLGQMLDELAPGEVDGFSLHSYGGGDLSSSLGDFQGTLMGQLELIDDAGFTDLPVFVTEWNRHTPSAGYESTSAQFLHGAFEWLHDWNTTPGSHNIVAACWFVYPKSSDTDPNDGWNSYSLLFWKTDSGTPDNDLWHAFQYAAGQDYPAGIHGGGGDPGINGASFEDDFEDAALDRFGPLPDWMPSVGSGATVTESGGALVLKGNSSSGAYAGVTTQGYAFADFVCKTRVRFVNTTSLDPASSNRQANAEIRFRLRDQGYSLTLDAERDQVNLRRANLWTVIDSFQQTLAIDNGDAFSIQIRAQGGQLRISVARLGASSGAEIDWMLENSEYASGIFQLNSYCMEEVHFEIFEVAVTSGFLDWEVY